MQIEIEETKEVAVKEAAPVAVYDNETATERMMRIALENDNIDALEKLILLKNQEEDRLNRKEFDLHFAAMQQELIPVKKVRDGSKTKGGDVTFKYAPLEEIQSVNNPVIHKHGFSYRWREETVENGDKRVRLIISGHGWTDEETYFDVPKIGTNSLTTDVQTRGMQSSYGKRYTFIAGFGITIEGEDDETKLGFSDGVAYADMIAKIMIADNPDQLSATMKGFWQQLGADHKGKAVLNEYYKKRSAELSGAAE